MKYKKLKDLCSFSQGKQININNQYLNKYNNYVRFLRIVDYTSDSEPIRYVKNYGEKFVVEEDDIIMMRYGSKTAGKVVRGKSGLIANNMFKINPYSNVVDKGFLYYYLSSEYFYEMLNKGQSSSTMPAISFGMLENIEIVVPSIDLQKKIVSFLDTINKKIANNIVINDNLQWQALNLYKHMFIDNQSCDWKKGTLSDIAEITMGQSPSGSSYNEDGIGTVFFQGRAEFGFRFPRIRLYTTEPKRIAQKNDVLMSVRAPVGDFNIAHEDSCIGRGLSAIHSNDNHQSFVLYTMFSLKKQLEVFNGEGTVFGSINRDTLSTMPIVIPSYYKIEEFENIAAKFDAMILNNYENVCHLQQIRDTLLPKFMSGEVNL